MRLFVSFLTVAVLVAWFVNVIALFSCDFKSDYRCEVMHGIGVFVAPLSLATVWYPTDKEEY